MSNNFTALTKSEDRYDFALLKAQKAMTPLQKHITVQEENITKVMSVMRRGVGLIDTEHGAFYLYDFFINDQWGQYFVLMKASVDDNFFPQFANQELLTLRIDSGCCTGQLFFDRSCECKDQLLESMGKINLIGEGMIINIPGQDGRGMGLPFKLATLIMQQEYSLDTVEAAQLLAQQEQIDTRSYGGVIAILKFFNIVSCSNLCIATNNPRKVSIFAKNNYVLMDNLPVKIQPNEFTKKHLEAKKKYLGHIAKPT